MGSKIEQKIQKRARFQEENFKRYILHVLFVFFLTTKKKGVEKSSTLGIINDMQIQSTKTYQLTPVRMTIIKN